MVSFFDCESQVVPLITYNDGSYKVDEDTMEWLSKLKNIAVIACAGKYRTGKSFLLNRLAQADSSTGFGVGDSVQACTKGLWIFKKVFEYEDKSVLFVDTEGIDALDANDTHDVRIFTLALLLSSSFIYNSMGPIDETALQTLSLMTRVTENVKFDHGDTTPQELSPHMPRFYWILRDFALKLKDRDNNDITENEYLQEALNPSHDPTKNGVRDSIRNAFGTRNLITLPRPSSTIDPSAQRMEDRLKSLSASFVKGVDSLRTRLMQETPCMMAQDTVLSGSMYASLCRHFAEKVQTDSVPVIKDSWSLMSSIHARDLKDNLVVELEKYLSEMKPKRKSELENDMKLLKESFVQRFRKQSMRPIDKEVEAQFVDKMSGIVQENQKRLEIDVQKLVEESFEALEVEINDKPAELSIILNRAMKEFGDRFDNDSEYIQIWMASATERSLCRWIPRSLQALTKDKEDILEECKTERERYENELVTCRDEMTEELRKHKIYTSELEQLNQSNNHRLNEECQETIRLQHEMIVMSMEMHHMDQIVPTHVEKTMTHARPDKAAMDLQDELSVAQIENAELRANVAMEKQNHEKVKRSYNETKDRLERAMQMQAKLEENMKECMHRVQAEQQSLIEEQKKDFEMRLEQKEKDLKNSQKHSQHQEDVNAELTHENQQLRDKIEHESNMSEKTISQLRDASQKYREESDQAQQRVLEIHKSMLDDLRIRDEKAREQQNKYLQETTKLQHKLAETQRENDANKSELLSSKRRLDDLENLEIDLKRIKTSEREKDIIIGQLKAESKELRSTNAELTADRERLRQENMKMEGDLTMMKAEAQFLQVRRELTK